jgi:hypothetical protein
MKNTNFTPAGHNQAGIQKPTVLEKNPKSICDELDKMTMNRNKHFDHEMKNILSEVDAPYDVMKYFMSAQALPIPKGIKQTKKGVIVFKPRYNFGPDQHAPNNNITHIVELVFKVPDVNEIEFVYEIRVGESEGFQITNPSASTIEEWLDVRLSTCLIETQAYVRSGDRKMYCSFVIPYKDENLFLGHATGNGATGQDKEYDRFVCTSKTINRNMNDSIQSVKKALQTAFGVSPKEFADGWDEFTNFFDYVIPYCTGILIDPEDIEESLCKMFKTVVECFHYAHDEGVVLTHTSALKPIR